MLTRPMAKKTLMMWAAISAAIPVAAQPAEPPHVSAIDTLKACRGITQSDQRLSCFDKAAASLDTAIAAHDITVLDKQDIRRARRSLFGFTIPNIALFGGGSPKDAESPEFTEMDSTIKAIHGLGYGKFEIVIAEGAVWHNTDAIDFPPSSGTKIHIRKGAMGNYFLKFGSERSVRGTRVR